MRRARISVRPNVRPGARGPSSSLESQASLGSTSDSQAAGETSFIAESTKPVSTAEMEVPLEKDAEATEVVSSLSGKTPEMDVDATGGSISAVSNPVPTPIQRRKRFSALPILSKPRVSSELPCASSKASHASLPTVTETPNTDVSEEPSSRLMFQKGQAAATTSSIKENIGSASSGVCLDDHQEPSDRTTLLHSSKTDDTAVISQNIEYTSSKSSEPLLPHSALSQDCIASEKNGPSTSALPVKATKYSDRERIIKDVKLKLLMREEKKKERRKRISPRYLCKDPNDHSKMTMRDLIYYLPDTNPMTPLVTQEQAQDGSLPTPRRELQDSPQRVEEQDDVEDEPAEDDDEMVVPKIKVAEDGTLILDEESLTVRVSRNTGPTVIVEGETVFERGSTTTYSSFRTVIHAKIWSERETDMFFLAVSMVGTDFSLIGQLLTHRTRAEIKNKFKKEERVNSWRVDKAFREKTPYDPVLFRTLLERTLALDKKEKDDKKNLCKAARTPRAKSSRKPRKGKKTAEQDNEDLDVQDKESCSNGATEDLEAAEKENEDCSNIIDHPKKAAPRKRKQKSIRKGEGEEEEEEEVEKRESSEKTVNRKKRCTTKKMQDDESDIIISDLEMEVSKPNEQPDGPNIDAEKKNKKKKGSQSSRKQPQESSPITDDLEIRQAGNNDQAEEEENEDEFMFMDAAALLPPGKKPKGRKRVMSSDEENIDGDLEEVTDILCETQKTRSGEQYSVCLEEDEPLLPSESSAKNKSKERPGKPKPNLNVKKKGRTMKSKLTQQAPLPGHEDHNEQQEIEALKFAVFETETDMPSSAEATLGSLYMEEQNTCSTNLANISVNSNLYDSSEAESRAEEEHSELPLTSQGKQDLESSQVEESFAENNLSASVCQEQLDNKTDQMCVRSAQLEHSLPDSLLFSTTSELLDLQNVDQETSDQLWSTSVENPPTDKMASSRVDVTCDTDSTLPRLPLDETITQLMDSSNCNDPLAIIGNETAINQTLEEKEDSPTVVNKEILSPEKSTFEDDLKWNESYSVVPSGPSSETQPDFTGNLSSSAHWHGELSKEPWCVENTSDVISPPICEEQPCKESMGSSEVQRLTECDFPVTSCTSYIPTDLSCNVDENVIVPSKLHEEINTTGTISPIMDENKKSKTPENANVPSVKQSHDARKESAFADKVAPQARRSRSLKPKPNVGSAVRPSSCIKVPNTDKVSNVSSSKEDATTSSADDRNPEESGMLSNSILKGGIEKHHSSPALLTESIQQLSVKAEKSSDVKGESSVQETETSAPDQLTEGTTFGVRREDVTTEAGEGLPSVSYISDSEPTFILNLFEIPISGDFPLSESCKPDFKNNLSQSQSGDQLLPLAKEPSTESGEISQPVLNDAMVHISGSYCSEMEDTPHAALLVHPTQNLEVGDVAAKSSTAGAAGGEATECVLPCTGKKKPPARSRKTKPRISRSNSSRPVEDQSSFKEGPKPLDLSHHGQSSKAIGAPMDGHASSCMVSHTDPQPSGIPVNKDYSDVSSGTMSGLSESPSTAPAESRPVTRSQRKPKGFLSFISGNSGQLSSECTHARSVPQKHQVNIARAERKRSAAEAEMRTCSPPCKTKSRNPISDSELESSSVSERTGTELICVKMPEVDVEPTTVSEYLFTDIFTKVEDSHSDS